MIMQHEVNMTLGYFASTTIRDYYMTPSYVYYTSNLVWIIPPGREISSLEKLSKPFRMSVWICFLLVLGIAFFVGGVFKFQPKKSQNFLFGDNINSPCLNIVNVVLGGPMHKLPVRNFARTVLIMFMIYCMIMQNSYKGGLVKFMQMKIREPEIKSTDEIIAKNFTFYMLKSSKAVLMELPKILELAAFTSVADYANKLDQAQDPEFKGAILSSKDHLAYRNIKAFPNKFYRHAPETIFNNNIVVYMRKHSCLTFQINQVMIYLVNGGLIEKWASLYIDKNFLKHRSTPKAISLTMQQLYGAFQLLLLGLCISFAFFLIENLLPYYKLWF